MMKKVLSVIVCFAVAILMAVAAWPGRSGRRWRGRLRRAGRLICKAVFGHRRPRRSPFDFDGDGKTDVSIFRPAVGEWWYLKSSTGGNGALQFTPAHRRPRSPTS